jgi:hypothetical protein
VTKRPENTARIGKREMLSASIDNPSLWYRLPTLPNEKKHHVQDR